MLVGKIQTNRLRSFYSHSSTQIFSPQPSISRQRALLSTQFTADIETPFWCIRETIDEKEVSEYVIANDDLQ